jgi:lipoprotein NlpD
MPLITQGGHKNICWTASLMRLLLLWSVLFFCSCSSGVYHTVKSGQTLYRISKTYNVDQNYLARVNGITDPAKVRVGTRLYIPGADSVKTVAVVQSKVKTSSSMSKVPSTVVVKQATTKQATTQQATTQQATTQQATTQQATTQQATTKQATTIQATKQATAKQTEAGTKIAVKKVLHWPLRGEIVSSFSQEVEAGHGRGIEIAVSSGSTVAAAAAGKVIYSGDGVNGYGHLIILQHEDDLFTVYGFNQKNFVSQGDFVSQGERIAMSGVPPSGSSARLHFEVRCGKQPVDPILYLP